jgi:hypothetical protein
MTPAKDKRKMFIVKSGVDIDIELLASLGNYIMLFFFANIRIWSWRFRNRDN